MGFCHFWLSVAVNFDCQWYSVSIVVTFSSLHIFVELFHLSDCVLSELPLLSDCLVYDSLSVGIQVTVKLLHTNFVNFRVTVTSCCCDCVICYKFK